jgi:homoserine kinase type II
VSVNQYQQISKIVENLYDIGTVTAIDEILGGYNSRSFGIQTHKDGCTRTYFLRKYKIGVSSGEIRFEHALISHAIKNDFTICAGIVASAAGETFVQPAHSRSMFAIYEYLDGEDKYTWDNPALSDVEFKNAGRVLAIFHNAVHDFNPGGLQRTEPPILALWPRLAQKFAAFAHQKKAEKW